MNLCYLSQSSWPSPSTTVYIVLKPSEFTTDQETEINAASCGHHVTNRRRNHRRKSLPQTQLLMTCPLQSPETHRSANQASSNMFMKTPSNWICAHLIQPWIHLDYQQNIRAGVPDRHLDSGVESN